MKLIVMKNDMVCFGIHFGMHDISVAPRPPQEGAGGREMEGKMEGRWKETNIALASKTIKTAL